MGSCVERGSTELSEVVLPERVDALKKTSAWQDYMHTDTHINKSSVIINLYVFNTSSVFTVIDSPETLTGIWGFDPEFRFETHGASYLIVCFIHNM